MIVRRLAFLLAMVLALLLMTAVTATAGTYTTYSCRTPSGHLATTDGWSGDVELAAVGGTDAPIQEGSGGVWTTDECGTNTSRVLATGLGEHHNYQAGDRYSLVYSAPQDTAIAGFSAAVCGVPGTAGTAAAITWTGSSYWSPGGIRAQYGDHLGCSSTASFTYVTMNGLGAPALWFSAVCTVAPCHWDNPNYSYPDVVGAGPYHAGDALAATQTTPAPCLMVACWTPNTGAVAVGSLVATLRDDLAPAVANVGGALAGTGHHAGSESLSFDATDRGAGIYRVVAQSRSSGTGDWQTVARSLVDTNGAKCLDAGENPTTDYEFANPLPCQLTVHGARLTVDTSQLPQGTTEFRAYVEDAAGNRTDIVPPRPFTVAGLSGLSPSTAPDGPVAQLAANNGIRASRTAFMRLSGSGDRHVHYGKRVTLKGRLMDDHGRPIAGASLEIVGRILLPNVGATGSWQALGAVVTDKRGRFAARVPAGVSRSLAVVYRANLRDPGWTTTAQTDVLVSAGVRLRAADANVRNKHRVYFRGRVAGDIPKGGLLVTIQVRAGSAWIPVATTRPEIHTDAHGRFNAAYKFERTYTAASFSFRAIAHRDSTFPFELGHSNGVVVHVRP